MLIQIQINIHQMRRCPVPCALYVCLSFDYFLIISLWVAAPQSVLVWRSVCLEHVVWLQLSLSLSSVSFP